MRANYAFLPIQPDWAGSSPNDGRRHRSSYQAATNDWLSAAMVARKVPSKLFISVVHLWANFPVKMFFSIFPVIVPGQRGGAMYRGRVA